MFFILNGVETEQTPQLVTMFSGEAVITDNVLLLLSPSLPSVYRFLFYHLNTLEWKTEW